MNLRLDKILILLIVVVLSACDKDHLFDCLKSTGNTITEDRISGAIQRIDVYDNVDVIITQDSINRIRVEAGDNIISGITTELRDGVLTIRNENTCNWVRSYSTTIVVHVHVKKLDIIHHYGSATVSSANQLGNSTFDLNIWNSGDMNLSLSADSVYSRQHTTVGDMKLSGQTGYCFVYNNGNAFTYESGFLIHDAVIVQRGTGDIFVHVIHSMNAEIHDSGNIYYSGTPQVSSNITGSGRLIHQ